MGGGGVGKGEGEGGDDDTARLSALPSLLFGLAESDVGSPREIVLQDG
eukprot:CAMPEP_0197444614 /NCGR_PEP_ID=MMETSP1175-20131217/10055_1 /TAXON_ID=1003142 /ORGANISM="Triceratium dubium, Strain CCMP147" /LENGTH=47 /DNA_ID= /DNA_START= /DNA_END= /DNA_ORIENTATION=